MFCDQQAQPIFAHEEETLLLAGHSFRLCKLQDLDTILEHYVRQSAKTERIPYYTQLWDSALALGKYVLLNQELFVGKRVLELGCGLGLPSLCAAKAGAQVLATDFHPDNRGFFMKNVALNGLQNIVYCELDWRQPGLSDQFDCILGSDLIYEREMLPALLHCVKHFMGPQASFIYADPGRAALQEFSSSLEKLGMQGELLAIDEIYLQIWSRH